MKTVAKSNGSQFSPHSPYTWKGHGWPTETSGLPRLQRTSLVVVALAAALSSGAQVLTLDVSALIDGRDELIIQGNTLQWHHFDYAAVGRHDGQNAPTVITTTLNGVTVMDHVNWIPNWPAPPPDPIEYEAYSSIFTGLSPLIGARAMVVEIDAINVRGVLGITQLPTAANNFTTILDFNDDVLGGDAIYEGRLTFEMVPEPSVAGLAALGGLALWLRWWSNRSLRRRPHADANGVIHTSPAQRAGFPGPE